MAEIDVNVTSKEEIQKPKSLIGVRHFQFVLMFFTFIIVYGTRTSISVAIIPMTSKTPPDPSIPTYPEWDNSDVILSSFFWGYIVMQVGAGQLGERFGPKWFLVGSTIVGSILHMITPPMAAALGSTGVIVCRVLQGLSQGFLYPSIHCLLSKWTPIYERSKVLNFVYGAQNLGIAIAMPVTGSIAGSRLGWPVAFYLYGGLGIGWAIIFAIFAENSPSTHKRISEEERVYIERSTSVTKTEKKIPTPWKSILTSLPVWATFIAGAGQCYGYFTLLTEMPSYLDGVLDFDINSNSQLSALPYVAQFLVGLISSPIFDTLVSKKIVSITTARKIANSVATFPPAAALMYLAFLQDFRLDVIIALLIVAVGTAACIQSGYLVNLLDLAPNHSGTLLGLVNGGNGVFSLLAPLTVGFFGREKADPLLWRNVFLLAAGLYLGCGLFYILFTSAEVQPWNDEKEKVSEKDKQVNQSI